MSGGFPGGGGGLPGATWTMPGPTPAERMAIAVATERTQDRLLRLLWAQKSVIEAQIEEATRRRDDATRDYLAACPVGDMTGGD